MKGIQKIFSEIPDTYELVNHVLTFGLDSLWRKRASVVAARGGGNKWLDVCSGTGQMARHLRWLADEKVKVIAIDFCLPMLRKVVLRRNDRHVHLCVADAGALPFDDNTFDLVTISFATRNINISKDILMRYFQELRRIIKPGGRLVNLETSQPESIFTRKLFHLYVRLVVMPVGYLLSGSKTAYRYLSYTIPRFFCAGELSAIIYQSGFRKVKASYMTFGITAIHIAMK